MKKSLKVVGKVLLGVMLFLSPLISQTVFGASLDDSVLVTGTKNLVNAIISWLTGIGITICGGYFIYYVYCLKTNDEGERRRNIQNIKTTGMIFSRDTTYPEYQRLKNEFNEKKRQEEEEKNKENNSTSENTEGGDSNNGG